MPFHLGIDLVADHDFDRETLGKVRDPQRIRESRACRLDADSGGSSGEDLSHDLCGRRDALGGQEGHATLRHQPSARHDMVGGTQLLAPD
jgi:hypothetical protein